jgi:hypothetical protein
MDHCSEYDMQNAIDRWIESYTYEPITTVLKFIIFAGIMGCVIMDIGLLILTARDKEI